MHLLAFPASVVRLVADYPGAQDVPKVVRGTEG